jgi:hypothetical protein
VERVPVVRHQKRAGWRCEGVTDTVRSVLDCRNHTFRFGRNVTMHKAGAVAQSATVEAEPEAARRATALLKHAKENRITFACKAEWQIIGQEKLNRGGAVSGRAQGANHILAGRDAPRATVCATRIRPCEVREAHLRTALVR